MHVRDDFDDSDEECLPRKSPKWPKTTPRLTGLELDDPVLQMMATGLSPVMKGKLRGKQHIPELRLKLKTPLRRHATPSTLTNGIQSVLPV